MQSHASEFLLIDVSNSFTKLARSSAEQIVEVQQLATADVTVDALRHLIGENHFDLCVLSSVVPAKNPEVEKFCSGTPLLVVGPGTDLGVRVDLPAPVRTGSDRLANVAFAAELGVLPVVVVDFGTAATFDVVTRDRAFVGGVIAPGLEAMTSYLHTRTALLPRIDLREPSSPIGKTTEDAMRAGAIYGYRGLVRGILEEIKRNVSPRRDLEIIAAGGYAEWIGASLPEIRKIHPHLTLEGLRIIARRNVAGLAQGDRPSIS